MGDFFCHDALSAKNDAKLGSNDKEYCKLCRQASKDVIDSCLVSDHCFGALLEFMFYQVIQV